MFDSYINSGKNVCIVAPRQSGKSVNLRKAFMDTPDSFYVVHDDRERNTIIDYFIRHWSMEERYLRRHVLTPRMILHDRVFRGAMVSAVFMDELSVWSENIFDVVDETLPCLRFNGSRLVAATTPYRGVTREILEGLFDNVVRLPYDFFENHTGNREEGVNHFEEELFTI